MKFKICYFQLTRRFRYRRWGWRDSRQWWIVTNWRRCSPISSSNRSRWSKIMQLLSSLQSFKQHKLPSCTMGTMSTRNINFLLCLSILKCWDIFRVGSLPRVLFVWFSVSFIFSDAHLFSLCIWCSLFWKMLWTSGKKELYGALWWKLIFSASMRCIRLICIEVLLWMCRPSVLLSCFCYSNGISWHIAFYFSILLKFVIWWSADLTYIHIPMGLDCFPVAYPILNVIGPLFFSFLFFIALFVIIGCPFFGFLSFIALFI